MADDLLVTDAVLEDPEVLRRLLSNMIERLDNTTLNELSDELKAKIIETLNKNSSIAITGDVIGNSNFDDTGDASIASAINLPNVTAINGGGAASTYPSQAAGPYGVAGIPDGGTPGQVLTKNSAINQDASWKTAFNLFASSGWCPGYTATYVDSNTFKVVGVDASKVYTVGRTLEVVDGSNIHKGTVNSVDYNVTSTGDTTVNMTMTEGALTAGITEACLVGSSVSWANTSKPLGNNSVYSITEGIIGTTNFIIASGMNGKIAYSIDGGVTFTQVNSGTAVDIIGMAYDSTNERFMGIVNSSQYVYSTDGINWSAEADNLYYLFGDYYNSIVIYYDPEDDGFMVFVDKGGQTHTAYTTNFGTTWTLGDTDTTVMNFIKQSEGLATTTNTYAFMGRGDDLYYIASLTTTMSLFYSNSGLANLTAICTFQDGGNLVTVAGHSDGRIMLKKGISTYNDTITFTGAIKDIEYSSIHQRLVAVGENGEIGYVDKIDMLADNPWTLVSNGFDVLRTIRCVKWIASIGKFFAGCESGQIASSSSGLN